MIRKLIPLLLSLFVVMGSLQFGHVVKAEQNGSDVSEVVKLMIVEKDGFIHPGISVGYRKVTIKDKN